MLNPGYLSNWNTWDSSNEFAHKNNQTNTKKYERNEGKKAVNLKRHERWVMLICFTLNHGNWRREPRPPNGMDEMDEMDALLVWRMAFFQTQFEYRHNSPSLESLNSTRLLASLHDRYINLTIERRLMCNFINGSFLAILRLKNLIIWSPTSYYFYGICAGMRNVRPISFYWTFRGKLYEKPT